MNSSLSTDYASLKRNFLFFIIIISTMFVSLSEKSEACIYNTSQEQTSFSKTAPQNSFFSDYHIDLSEALAVYHFLDTDKNPLASKKSFSYIRLPDNTRPKITNLSVCNTLHLNQFRSTVLLI